MGLATQHKKLEKNINLLAIGSFIAVAIGGIVEIAPLFWMNNTIEEVEAKIQEFIRGQIGDSFTPPEGGVLKLAFEGSPLANDATILDAHVADMAHVDVLAEEEET